MILPGEKSKGVFVPLLLIVPLLMIPFSLLFLSLLPSFFSSSNALFSNGGVFSPGRGPSVGISFYLSRPSVTNLLVSPVYSARSLNPYTLFSKSIYLSSSSP
jgi:hypothetical protein